MYVFIVVILLLVVLVFGVVSGMQSYASAQQARAQIETAQVAQVNAWGNLIVSLVLTLIILVVVAVILWIFYRFTMTRHQQYRARLRPANPSRPMIGGPELSPLDQLVELEKLRLLRDLRGEVTPMLPAPAEKDEQPLVVNDPLYWLK